MHCITYSVQCILYLPYTSYIAAVPKAFSMREVEFTVFPNFLAISENGGVVTKFGDKISVVTKYGVVQLPYLYCSSIHYLYLLP